MADAERRAHNNALSTRNMPGYTWKHMPLVSAIVYSIISIIITLLNKAVLTSYGAGRARAAAITTSQNV